MNRREFLPEQGKQTPAVRLPLRQRKSSSGHPVMQALNPRVYQTLIWYAVR